MIVASHAPAELHAVLTTSPVSPRITTDMSWTLTQKNVLGNAKIVALTAALITRMSSGN
jgi:hypothetical protein